MENHTSASMYIPSSTVLARLQRHAEVTGRPKCGTPVLIETCTDASESSGADGHSPDVKCILSCTHSPTSRDHQIGVSTPLEESTTTSGAAAAAHCTVFDAATPPKPFTTPCAAPPLLSPQIPGSGNNSAAAVEAPTPAQNCGAAQPISSASLPPASVWLLPQADVEYILSSLTWNVDLLRLLLSHASCPLHLPEAEPLAEVPPHTARAPPTAPPPTAPTATSPTPPCSNTMDEEEANADASRGPLAVRPASTGSSHGGTMMDIGASSVKTLQSAEAHKGSDAPISASRIEVGAANGAGDTYNNLVAVDDAPPNSSSSSPSSALTTEVREDEPPAAISTLPLTWSQYLFGGAGSRIRTVVRTQADGVSDREQELHRHQRLSALARTRAPPPASARIARKTLPHSHSDGALMPTPNTDARRPPAPTSASAALNPSSIFHAQYLPSLKELERELEEHKQHQQHQQQQQHTPTLSVTRLEQHLLQQQQQSRPQHHRRRAATNRTFFYSPTPSVMSLSTTNATATVHANARDNNEDDEGEEEEQQQQQQQNAIRTTAVTSGLSHAHPYSSRPAPSQPRQLSTTKMMKRTADRLRATIAAPSSSAGSPSPLLLRLLHSRDGGLGHPTSDVIAHETAPDGEADEEGTSSPPSPSERCSVWSPGSPPASPTVSLNSMSLSRAWSRTVSGRGTPQTIPTTGLSCSGVKHNSNPIAGDFTSVSNASPHSTARGGKSARRRRKAKHTRRHRPIRVYMPSITEGPKAASLYTAPTAEAQELLLLLQQRKATALLHSGPSGWPMEGHGATTTALSPSPLMPGTYATADRAGLAASTTTTTSETLSVMQPRSSNSASAGVGVSTQEPEQQQQQQQHSLPSSDSSPSMRPSRDKQAERSPHHSPTLPDTELTADTTPFVPLPQRAGVSGAGSATIRATDGSPFSAAHEQPYPHQPRPSPPLSASRCPSHSTCPLMQTMDQTEQQLSGDWVTSPLRSHATLAESLSLSWSGMASPTPPAATAALTQPKSSSLVGGHRGEGGADPYGVTLGVGGRRGDAQVRRCTDAPARTCREQSIPPPCTSASAVSVELPQWVRERPLSALYYQPWGLELLARYEAARHEQQLMRGRMTGRDESNGGRSSSTTSGAVSGAGVSREAKQPLSTAASTVANSVSSSCNASLYSVSTAARHPSMRLCSSLGTGGGGSNTTTTTTPAAGAAGESPRSSACSLGISWAEALRQSQHITLTPGSSNVFGSARATATVKANRMTATATMNNCISINTATEQQQHPPPVVLPEWPPELLAAEEMDAWEEAYYFDRATTLPPWPPRQPHKNPTSRSGTKPLDSTTRHTKVDHTDDRNATSTTELAGCVAGTAAVAVSTKSLVQKKMQVNKEMQPSAPHLSRQRRSSRRRSRATYASDTFRSSAARRAGATSAAAELFHRRGDDNPTASAAVLKGAACPPTGQSPTPASVASIGDVTPYNDGHPCKNAAQLLCPKSSVQKAWAPLPPPPVFNSDHHAIGQGADASGSMALLLSVSLGGESDAMERDGAQQRVGMDNAQPAKGAQVKVDTSLRPVEPRDVDQAMEKSRHDKSEETTDDSCPRSSSNSSDAMKGAASVMSNTCDSAHAERPCTDVDVIFFLQKFIRAVLIVFIAQVRLQQQLQQHQQREVHAPTPHDMTCPVTAYLLEQQAQSQPLHGLHRWYPRHADPSDRAAAASHGSDEAGLSKLERCALAFVRTYMEDYREMITACVMRDEREVARRSAQAILNPPRSATSSSSAVAAVAKSEAMDRMHNTAPDPLFRQDVFAGLLDADRVNRAYREAVRAATGGFLGAPDAIPPATPLDDVESLRTAQVYISGKDAAWQPLLMELLQMSRVVQCYGDGPVVAASGAPHATFSASAASPQRNLLSSLEKFLAHPTLPLLRQANPGAARATQALETVLANPTAPSSGTLVAVPDPPDFKLRTSTTSTTTLSLTPEQEKAAALMVEESDAFRIYLLSGYLRDTNNNNNATAAAAAAAVTAPTAMLRHSQSAPALSVREAQQWQESSVTTTAAMSPSRLFTAGSLLQPLTWYPYAYMPGTANPYAESSHPASTPKSAAEAATASAMTLSVTMLPLSGRLLWRWVVPAEDTDTFNLSVFFQSSLFSFMQGGPLPMPSAVPGQVVVGEWSCWSSPAAAAGGDCAAGYVPTPAVRSMAPPKPPHHPSVTWPPALAARIDAQLRSDAFRSAWGGVPPPCLCGHMAAAICKGHEEVPRAGLWAEMPEVVLVHCSAGMHRSCGILVAFLLWLLYQCRQVLRSEQILNGGPPSHPRAPAPTRSAGVGIADQAAVEALLLNDTDTQTHAPASAEDVYQAQQQQQQQQQSMSGMKNSAVDVKAPRLTSRLLQRTIRHVQQRRNIAVPIRTVQYLLQSFANELQLN
ncbi:hypothetical protein JKF63_07737 [Porcisia hertigi]|uniref:Uncharacterized protein n=1 Tax=Porcisia hertigi TaxID=2761500 RepID=A0A836LLR6_9TRYP|nr:hypothetical protein JKF63_07737 [Porcisia hertigi]